MEIIDKIIILLITSIKLKELIETKQLFFPHKHKSGL